MRHPKPPFAGLTLMPQGRLLAAPARENGIFTLLIALVLLLASFAVFGQTSPFDSGQTLPSSQSTSTPDFLPVDQAYEIEVQTDAPGLTLNWRIENGYYLYRHGFRAIVDSRDISDTADMPHGELRHDELFGEVEVYYGQLTITLPAPAQKPYRIELRSQGCADAGLCYPPRIQHFEINTATHQAKEVPPPILTTSPSPQVAPATTEMNLVLAATFAFLGGLILNLMPCVLPVLSLKAIGLARSSESRNRRIAHGWWYTAGILASFVTIATVLIGLKWGGSAVGWGFQLQSSWFVATLVYLFFTMALLLVGAADFSGSWMGFGQTLANGGGYRGSFFTGALAVLVASPCTAPFMGTAMGFALAQSTASALLIFICLGFGMAAPFLILSYLPRLGQLLPAPGAWMERFRQFLAFPLLATAVWLLWVIGHQVGSDAVTLVLGGCLLLALALWLNGSNAAVRTARLILLGSAITLLASPQLQAPQAGTEWEADYSAEKVTQLQRKGETVFVNFTAAWCITCLANEKWVLSSDAVRNAFKDYGVTYLKADWTNRDPEITAALEEFGRSGIPLYLVFPGRAGTKATVLPQVLSLDLIIEALQESSAANSPSGKLAAN